MRLSHEARAPLAAGLTLAAVLMGCGSDAPKGGAEGQGGGVEVVKEGEDTCRTLGALTGQWGPRRSEPFGLLISLQAPSTSALGLLVSRTYGDTNSGVPVGTLAWEDGQILPPSAANQAEVEVGSERTAFSVRWIFQAGAAACAEIPVITNEQLVRTDSTEAQNTPDVIWIGGNG